MRLIDADALLAAYDREHVGLPGGARKLIEEAPTVEAEPVRRCNCVCEQITHSFADGYSIEIDSKRKELSIWYYDSCLAVFEANYCPNCGAKMDGGANDE